MGRQDVRVYDNPHAAEIFQVHPKSDEAGWIGIMKVFEEKSRLSPPDFMPTWPMSGRKPAVRDCSFILIGDL